MAGAGERIKCVVVGDGAVGKTCMLTRYVTDSFPTDHVPTVFDNHSMDVTYEDKSYTLSLLDTAGQEEFDRLRVLQYPGTDAFLLCFSVASPTSLSNATDMWIHELRQHEPKAPIIMVATQMDLRSDSVKMAELAKYGERPVTASQGRRAAKNIRAARYCECSALTQQGLADVFQQAVAVALGKSTGGPPKASLFSCFGR